MFSRNSIVTIDEENQKRCVVRRFEPCWQSLHLEKTVGLGYNIISLNSALILFVGGSDKKDQKKVIQQANNYFTEYCERTHYDPNSRTN